MKTLSFEWDETKNRQNIKKHGISFHEATSIRIISARKATKREVDAYDNQEGGLLKWEKNTTFQS